MKRPLYFMLRLRRAGPLVPARIRWLDHAPDDPESNKLDRGRLSIIACVDIAGEVRPPEELTDRFHRGPGHWRYAEIITKAEYDYQILRRIWAERNRPLDPTLFPTQPVAPRDFPLPSFERENADR